MGFEGVLPLFYIKLEAPGLQEDLSCLISSNKSPTVEGNTGMKDLRFCPPMSLGGDMRERREKRHISEINQII